MKKNKVGGFHYLVYVGQYKRTGIQKTYTYMHVHAYTHIHTHRVRVNDFFNKCAKTIERNNSVLATGAGTVRHL